MGDMAAPQKHRACNRPGLLFNDMVCNKIRGPATNSPCDKLVNDYSTLHRGPRQGFVTGGPTKVCNRIEKGGPRQTLFRASAIYDM